jgi:hypothetical protein
MQLSKLTNWILAVAHDVLHPVSLKPRTIVLPEDLESGNYEILINGQRQSLPVPYYDGVMPLTLSVILDHMALDESTRERLMGTILPKLTRIPEGGFAFTDPTGKPLCTFDSKGFTYLGDALYGVMNTDNMSITSETFDYGPCAFMNIYNPNTVFSSIDYNGRYAFGNQYKIIAWNLVRFAESLLPVLDPNLKKSVELAQTALDGFEEMWREKYYTVLLKKIGIDCNNPELYFLVDELLSLMETQKMDYTNTFYDLSNSINDDEVQHINPTMKLWLEKWKNHIEHSSSTTHAKKVMQQNNPVIIPRNHLVEQALDDAIIGDLTLFESLLDALSKTYQYEHKRLEYMKSSNLAFEQSYQTFCGT